MLNEALAAAARSMMRRAAVDTTETLLEFVPRVSPDRIAPAHLQPIVDVMERVARRERVKACISCPPGSGKTATIQHAIVWLWRLMPWLRIAYVTYAQDQANAKSREVQDIAKAAGISLRDGAQGIQHWYTSGGGWFKATSIRGGLTGQHPHLIIYDDPYKNREDAESALTRALVWNHFTGVVLGRGAAMNASMLVVHTRWHPEDLTGRLTEHDREDGSWTFVNMPAVRDSTGEPWDVPADPSNMLLTQSRLHNGSMWGYTPEILNETRRLNEYDWWSIWQGIPRPRGGRVFGDAYFYDAFPSAPFRQFIACDPAGTAKTHSDFTVALHGRIYRGEVEVSPANGTPAVVIAFPVVYVTDMLRLQGRPEEVAPMLAEFSHRHGDCTLGIEGSRDGHSIAENLRSIDKRLRFRMLTPRGDKFIRAQPAASAWNHGRIQLPTQNAPWVPDMLAETSRFTGINDPHDDIVDALGWLHSMGEQAVPGLGADMEFGAVAPGRWASDGTMRGF